MNDIDLAYIAGFIDGEGSIGIHQKGDSNYYQIVIQVTNTDEAVLDWIHTILPASSKNLQKRNNMLHKPAYRLQYTGVNVQHMLIHITPFLRLKRELAEICLEFMGGKVYCTEKPRLTPEVVEFRKDLYERAKTINKRGVG